MRAIAVLFGFISAFFIFYTLRLLVVTHFLQRVRANGHGAYIGAIAFPILAIIFALACKRVWQHAKPSH